MELETKKEGIKIPSSMRPLKILETLITRIIKGYTINELVSILNVPYHTIHRDLTLLQNAGYVKEENHSYLPSEKFLAFGIAFQKQLAEAQEKLIQIQKNTNEQAEQFKFLGV